MRDRVTGLTHKQLALIHVARRDLKLTDDDYRSILQRFGGVTSSRALDLMGFMDVMRHFTALGFRSTWTIETFGERPGMASPSQVKYMRALWRETYGDDPGDMNIVRWLNAYFKVTALRFVTDDIAAKALPALKSMASR